VWEDGLGSTKEDAEQIWQGAAKVGLATFSIDLRHHGERGTTAQLLRVIRSPRAMADLVTGTVNDLQRGIAYLDAQPECHHDVGYAGTSLGGIIGTLLSAMDRQVRAAVIMSTPATWNALIHSTADVDQLKTAFLPGLSTHPVRLRRALSVLSPLDPDRYIGRIAPRPVLILHGLQDPVVPPSAAAGLIAAARSPKTVVSYTGGHIPLMGPSAAANARAITTFLVRNLVDESGSGAP
jgi:fermentation-respiration switch protein FrsA (DUF1100 family)